MTASEAIEAIKIAQAEVEWNYPMDYAVAFDMANKALEKQIAKRLIVVTNMMTKAKGINCPNCNNFLPYTIVPYCCYCGQKLDWGDE
jgi:hypothetical protein